MTSALPRPHLPMIYKICPSEEWAQAVKQEKFTGSALDRKDGFIHFSTAETLPGTLKLYFADAENIVLAAVIEARLSENLRFEPSRGGALFPHLYGDLPLSAVAWVKPLIRGADGDFVLPPLT